MASLTFCLEFVQQEVNCVVCRLSGSLSNWFQLPTLFPDHHRITSHSMVEDILSVAPKTFSPLQKTPRLQFTTCKRTIHQTTIFRKSVFTFLGLVELICLAACKKILTLTGLSGLMGKDVSDNLWRTLREALEAFLFGSFSSCFCSKGIDRGVIFN
jgi:hypothetical protein